ncbi:PLP-dependent aminotransferase family protein [Burkholderia ubonensis]|uniref:aminotransferase-like domain-containing protein n=1 Tax=Burkholderia ubonensis TaxID=101571 RepID=UPI0007C7A572|nr:PLP-dependent aminotransferase family protein [Burkholderia ubonensis]
MSFNWQDSFSDSANQMAPAPTFLALASRPDVISFAGGVPDPAVFPARELQSAYREILADPTARNLALQYAPSVGLPALRELIAEQMATRSIAVTADDIIVTSGAQQALDLVGKLLINPGDRVAVTAPTFFAALDTFNAYRPTFESIPFSSAGLDLERTEAVIRSKPRFVYVISDFQNPTGLSLSLDDREYLLTLCAENGVPILEDAAYDALRYSGEAVPAIAALAQRRGLGSLVIYVNTFSKTISPGLRVGWLAADPVAIKKLAALKLSTDVHTSVLNQMAVLRVIDSGFAQHVRSICETYSVRCSAMLASLQAHMPSGVTWTRPQGGLFVWVDAGPGVDMSAAFSTAVEDYAVAYVPGQMSFASGDARQTCRLSFATASTERIEMGIRALGNLVAQIRESGNQSFAADGVESSI